MPAKFSPKFLKDVPSEAIFYEAAMNPESDYWIQIILRYFKDFRIKHALYIGLGQV